MLRLSRAYGRSPDWAELHRSQPVSFSDEVRDETVAKWFGLEIAGILLDSSCSDFAVARYKSKKRLINQSRRPSNRR
jgi:hypothetical protein